MLSFAGTSGWLRRSPICTDASPTAPVKSAIAIIVPRPKQPR